MGVTEGMSWVLHGALHRSCGHYITLVVMCGAHYTCFVVPTTCAMSYVVPLDIFTTCRSHCLSDRAIHLLSLSRLLSDVTYM